MAKKRKAVREAMVDSAIDALDEIEPNLRHLAGLVTALRLLGEVDDSIEPIAIFSLAQCSSKALDEIVRNWSVAIGALRSG